jgi:hypothetical protein
MNSTRSKSPRSHHNREAPPPGLIKTTNPGSAAALRRDVLPHVQERLRAIASHESLQINQPVIPPPHLTFFDPDLLHRPRRDVLPHVRERLRAIASH